MMLNLIERRAFLRLSSAISLFFLLAPLLVVVVLSFNGEGNMRFPPATYGLDWFANFFERDRFMSALRFSALLAVCAAITASFCGTLLGLALASGKAFAHTWFLLILPLPIFVPEVVTGLGLLNIMSKLGVTDDFLRLWLAHAIITLPYATYTCLTNIRAFDVSLADASRSLGVGFWGTLWKVVLPLIKPGIIAGGIFAFLLSFDNLMISAFLLGPLDTTLPVEMNSYIRTKADPTVAAAATVLMLATSVAVFVTNKVFGLEQLLRIKPN